MRTGLVVTALLHLGMASLPAQQREAPFLRWEPGALSHEPTTSAQTAGGITENLGDYRYEGLALGGLVLGAAGVWVGSRISVGCPLEAGVPCPSNKAENAVALGLAGAVLGGGLGYLVGRFSPKKPSPVETGLPSDDLAGIPDSVRLHTGYQHWRGGAIGSAVGGVLGALTGIAVVDRCSDCNRASPGRRALTVGLVGAGAGGVLGFLVGLASPKYAVIPRGAP